MATSSVSGLASGLNTSDIIAQLMAIERNGQTRLKSRLTTEQSNVKSLQDLNSKLASLATSAERLAKPTGWNPVKVTSSSDKVTATPNTSPGAAPTSAGQLNFTVTQLATAHTVGFNSVAALTDVVVGGDPTKVTLALADGSTKEINAGNGTLQGLVNGINAVGTGLDAGLVKLTDGTFRLRVTSETTGAAGTFTLAASDGSALLGGSTVMTAGQDAVIEVGQDTISSASNTFAGVFNGLDVTLSAGLTAGTAVDLTVTQDSDSLVKNVKDLVDTMNGLLGQMDSITAYLGTPTTSATTASSSSLRTGTLAGDAQVRSVRSQLLETVYPQGGTTMATFGIQTDRYGKLVFDEAKLRSALQANPDQVTAAFTAGGVTGSAGGFAERVRSVAKGASDFVDGTITSAIKGRNDTISRLQTSIADWDKRLELREKTLTRQFGAMEKALSNLNAQSNWLASQLASQSRNDN